MPLGRRMMRSRVASCGRVEADLLEIEQLLGVGQQTHHEAFAVGHGHGREAHVVVASGDLEPDAAVLGQALLGDVEVAHDLDARGDAAWSARGRGFIGS